MDNTNTISDLTIIKSDVNRQMEMYPEYQDLNNVLTFLTNKQIADNIKTEYKEMKEEINENTIIESIREVIEDNFLEKNKDDDDEEMGR